MGTNVTLFTIPRHFIDMLKVRQENTLGSWIRLEPRPEIVLFCDDRGIKEAAEQYKCRYEPDVKRNKWGTPLISDVFRKVQEMAENDILCYVNTDIILMQEFMTAIDIVSKRFDQFLMIGQRWDKQVDGPLWGFPDKWQNRLRSAVRQQGKLHGPGGLDYFVFKRGLYNDIPPFAVGKCGWDNWLALHVRKRGIPTIDATRAVMVVHQGFSTKVPRNEEWQLNQNLYRKLYKGGIAGQTTETHWYLTKTMGIAKR